MSPILNEKIIALADILSVDESVIEITPDGEFCVDNTSTYVVATLEEDPLTEELYLERTYIEEEMNNSDLAFLVKYVDFDKYFNDINYTLEDFGWDRYTVNNKIYYIKEV